jgi:hypothetical protein
MRAVRLLTVATVALAISASRGVAQTCQGTAAFQDGRWRAGAFAHENNTVNDIGAGLAYGVPRSLYGDLSVDQSSAVHGGNPTTGFGLNVGYQIHISDTPFQFCPEVLGRYATGQSGGLTVTQVGFGGSLGYRFGLSDWFTLVPAAGISWIKTNTSERFVNLSGTATPAEPLLNGTSSQVFMAIGLVFHRSFTIVPGLLVPPQNGTSSIFTLGVSINWPSDPSR